MTSKKPSVSLLFGLLLIAILQVLYFYPKLPETVAYHFGSGGQADAWGTKSTFLLVDIILMIFLVIFFITLSRLPFKIPDSMMNIPNRDYWLSTERKQLTAQKTATFIIWFGVLTLFFLRILFHHIYYLNTEGPLQKIQHFWLGLLSYILALSVLTWRFYRSFYRKVT